MTDCFHFIFKLRIPKETLVQNQCIDKMKKDYKAPRYICKYLISMSWIHDFSKQQLEEYIKKIKCCVNDFSEEYSNCKNYKEYSLESFLPLFNYEQKPYITKENVHKYFKSIISQDIKRSYISNQYYYII